MNNLHPAPSRLCTTPGSHNDNLKLTCVTYLSYHTYRTIFVLATSISQNSVRSSTTDARDQLTFIMNSLSMIASTTAIVTVTQQICQAFAEVRSSCEEIPGRLHALNNEVVDMELVVQRLRKIAENRHTFKVLCQSFDEADDDGDIPQLLINATARLTEVLTFSRGLAISCGRSTHRVEFFRAQSWEKVLPKLAVMQDGIRTLKCRLNILVGTCSS